MPIASRSLRSSGWSATTLSKPSPRSAAIARTTALVMAFHTGFQIASRRILKIAQKIAAMASVRTSPSHAASGRRGGGRDCDPRRL